MPNSPEDPQPREPGSAPSHAPRSAPPPGTAEEALRRLEQRLDRASQAAERLMAEAAAEAARAGAGLRADSMRGGEDSPGRGEDDTGGAGGEQRSAEAPLSAETPPAGWQIPDDSGTPPSPDLDPLVGLVQALRDLIPPELQRRLVAALRELLLALRALIDWYLERLEQRREQSVELEDIPII
jgi:hypothetical protein